MHLRTSLLHQEGISLLLVLPATSQVMWIWKLEPWRYWRVSEKWTKDGNIIRHSPRCAHWKIPKCTKCTMLQFYISAGPPARTLEMTQMGWALVITGTKCEKKYCTSHMKVTSSNCLTIYTYYKGVQTVWCQLHPKHTHSPKTIIKTVISRNLSSLFFACNWGIFFFYHLPCFHSQHPITHASGERAQENRLWLQQPSLQQRCMIPKDLPRPMAMNGKHATTL